MRLFKISKNNKDYILSAQDKVDAVRKLRDAQNKSCDESLDEKERKAQEWVDYDIKHYGKVSETTKEEIRKMGLDFDKWDNQVKDSSIKDMRTVLASKLKKGDVILDNKNKPYKITSIDYEDGYVSLYADNLTEIGNARFTFDNDEKVKVKDSAIKDASKDINSIINYFNAWGYPSSHELQQVVDFYRMTKVDVQKVFGGKDYYTKSDLNKLKYYDSAIKDATPIKDARPDENTISSIEKAARNFRSNNISVAVITDADKDGRFIEEMYINTSGKWLETPQEADAYLRDLSNAIKFLKENYKYLGK